MPTVTAIIVAAACAVVGITLGFLNALFMYFVVF